MEDQNKEPLTETEAKIADYLQDGLSRGEIAEKEECSIHTVHTHCNRMYRKLGVNNVTGLLKWLREWKNRNDGVDINPPQQ